MADQFEVPKPLVELFEQIEENIALTQLGSSKWYMITLAALVGSNDPDLCADLYTHLLTKPEFSTPEQRQELVRRLREGLFKTISVVVDLLLYKVCVEEQKQDPTVTTRNAIRPDAVPGDL
ncbi:hypothetical protein BN1708_004367, partial [Verticillium longisporum]